VLPVRCSLEFALDQETESKYESSPSPSPSLPLPPYDMLQQQQQQQQGEPSQAPTPCQLPPSTREEQLLAMIATLQQQVNTMLLQQQGSRVEVARPQVFNGRMEEVSAFINAAHIYIRMQMTEEAAMTQVAWVSSYVQGGIAEVWKDNLMDELAKGESEVETVEQLFLKIRNDFGEMSEEERKIEQLWTIEQGGRTCDKYVQEFKKVARGSGYEGRPLIEEFKRGLNGTIRRKLAEAEEPPTTIGEWQERAVRLDRNQRQSRAEERMLGRNAAHPGGNAQPREGFGGGSYGGKEGQITWRAGVPQVGGNRGGGGNMFNRGGYQLGPWKDPNAMDIDRRREGIERAITVENLAIWPKIVGKGIKQG